MEHLEPARKEISDAVNRVLRERLGKLGFREAKVYAGEDHDGDPALFIEAAYDLVDEPIDAGATFGITRALREALESVGERRFPYLHNHFSEQQRVAGWS